jgi:hypothetical protein
MSKELFGVAKMAKKVPKDRAKDEHTHLGDKELECEKCGGEVRVLSAVNPPAYTCVCKKCKHRFSWIDQSERDLS